MGSSQLQVLRRWFIALSIGVMAAPCVFAEESSIIGRLIRRFTGEKRTAPHSTTEIALPVPAVLGSPVDTETATSLQGPGVLFEATAEARVVFDGATSQPEKDSRPPNPTDIELARFEEMAIARNPTFLQARASVEAALGRQLQAGLYPNPTIGYAGSEMGNEGRGGQQGIVLTQEIVRGGKLRLSSTIAGYERQQFEAQAEIQFWRLRNTIRSLYFQALASQETVRLMEELQSIAQKAENIARQRERAGEGTLADVLQTQIELDQVRLQARNAAQIHRAIWKRLAATVAQPETEPQTLRGNLEFRPTEIDELNALARIVAQSPEIQWAEAGIRRAEAAVARARVEPIPNVTVEAGTQYDFASRDTIVGVGLGLPIPVHNRNQGNVIAAESELRRSQYEVDRVRLAIAERYAATYAQYRNALEHVERYGARMPESEVEKVLAARGQERQQALDAHPQIVPRAQIALALATEGWQRGEFSYLQVLTAQRSLAQVRLGYVRALAELRQSVIALDGYLLTEPIFTPSGSTHFIGKLESD